MSIQPRILSCFFVICFSVLSHTAHADIVNMFAKVDCSESLNYLRVDVFNVNGDLARKRAEKDDKNIRDKENIVFFDDLVEINKDFYQKEKATFTKTCTLQEEVKRDTYKTVTYTVIIKPYFFNSNREGQCGGADSFSMTIKDKDRVLVDDVPFWFNCNKSVSSNVEEQTISTLMFLPHQGLIRFSGRYSRPIKPELYPSFTRRFWLDHNIPATKDNVYMNKN